MTVLKSFLLSPLQFNFAMYELSHFSFCWHVTFAIKTRVVRQPRIRKSRLQKTTILTKKLTIISTSISTMGIIYTKLGCYYVYTISFRAVNSLNFWPWVTNWFQFEIFDTWIWKMYFYVNTIHNGICLHLLENGYILLIVSCCNWHHNKY